MPGIRGARRGNRHALKHGRFTREAQAERAKLGEMLRGARSAIAEAKVLIRELDPVAPRPEARCDMLLSEDFQDGFAWNGITVCNPFAAKPHRLVAALLRE